MKQLSRLGRASRELKLFAIASLALGMAYSIYVFLLGIGIALVNLGVAWQVRPPQPALPLKPVPGERD